jgi:O-antigen/teichoic acid export membrane protein
MHFKRGTLFLVLGWGCVLVIGYVYHFILTRQLPVADYAVYLLVMSILQWFEIILINGLPYAVQRYASASPDQSDAILKFAMKAQAGVSVLLFGSTFLFAPQIAGLFKDPGLVPFIRLAVLDIPFIGFFHLLVSFENSRKAFHRQALLLVSYAVAKLGIGIVLVLKMHSANGALWANPLSAVIGAAIGFVLLRSKADQRFEQAAAMIHFTLPSVLYFLVLQLLLNMDLWLVKYFLGSDVVGFYGVAALLAKIPFYLFIGVSATLLPILSSSLSAGNHDAALATISQAMRFLWLLLAPVAVLISARSYDLITVLFKPEFADGAPVLSVLIWGVTLLSFINLFTTILNADHRPGLSFVLIFATVLLAVILNRILIPQYGAIGAAMAMLVSLATGALSSFFLIFRKFRIHFPLLSFARISLSALILWPLSRIFPVHGFAGIALLGTGVIVYAALLFFSKEIDREEIRGLVMGDR